MSRKKSGAKAERKRFSPEFKQQALLRAVKDGVPAVARDLGLEPAQLYAWRTKAQQQGEDAEAQRVQQAEAARLKREVTLRPRISAFRLRSTTTSVGSANVSVSRSATAAIGRYLEVIVRSGQMDSEGIGA